MVDAGPVPLSMEDLRPRTLAEIVGQPEVVGRLGALAVATRQRSIVPPNLIFHGPPGVGKTTAARAFAREVLGEDWENSFHELKVHDNRGPEFIQNRLIPTSRLAPSRGARLRIFFLDEAETLTPESQSALRPALESDTPTSMFILACNDLSRITGPIRSRCILLEFGLIRPAAMEELVRWAGRRWDLSLDAPAISQIVDRSGGIPREASKMLLEELGRRSAIASPV